MKKPRFSRALMCLFYMALTEIALFSIIVIKSNISTEVLG